MTYARLVCAAGVLAAFLGCGSKPASPGQPSGTAPAAQPKAALPEPDYFVPDPKTTSSLTGRVVFEGAAPSRKKLRIDEDPVCTAMNRAGLLDEAVIVHAGGALANTFVYIRTGLEGKRFRPPAAEQTVTIDQKSCRFEPHMIGVRTGQKIRVTNSDPLTHNIHPQPKENREWNQSQEQGAAALERKFVRPEMMIRVKCNVHSWMRAWVNVMDHPYYSVTDSTGAFELRDVPPGEYVVEAWQEKLGRKEIRIQVDPPGAEPAAPRKPLNFVFTAADVRD